MADIRTITILPTPAVPGVAQPQGAAGASPQGGAVIQNLPVGSILSGFIINRDVSGNPILRTDIGDITFSSNLFLKIGSEVTLRVEYTAGNTQAHILTVNGQPPEVAEAQSTQEPEVIVSQNLSTPQGQTAQAQTIAPTQPEAAPPNTTITVTGTVIAQPQPQPGAPQPALPNGTQLTLKVTGLTAAPNTIPEEIVNSAPQPAATPQAPASPASYTAYAKAAGNPSPVPIAAPAAAAPQTAVVPTQAAPAAPPTPIAAAPPTVAAPAPPVTTANIPAINVPTSATPVTTTVTPQPGQSIPATVIASEPSGEAIVQTPVGIVRLQPGTVLPTGSNITFEIASVTPPAVQTVAADTATAPMPAPITELAQHWTSLAQIFGLLAGRNTTSGFDFVKDTMPWVMAPPAAAAEAESFAAPQNISVGLMLFMSALKGGDFRNWLGESNSQWLQNQGHDALLQKAGSEFAMLARQFTETQPPHWQPVFFPVAIGGELQQARLFVKRDRKQGGNQQGKKTEDTRFVVEVDLTQLGEVQMDGFVRKQGKDVQFDLMIRSLNALSPEIQRGILQIYNDAGQLTGYKGSLAFQSVKEFSVNPMEEIAAHMGTVVA